MDCQIHTINRTSNTRRALSTTRTKKKLKSFWEQSEWNRPELDVCMCALAMCLAVRKATGIKTICRTERKSLAKTKQRQRKVIRRKNIEMASRCPPNSESLTTSKDETLNGPKERDTSECGDMIAWDTKRFTQYSIDEILNSIYKESKTQCHSQSKQSTGESETTKREIVSATRTMSCRSVWNGITDLTKRNYRAPNLVKLKKQFSESSRTGKYTDQFIWNGNSLIVSIESFNKMRSRCRAILRISDKFVWIRRSNIFGTHPSHIAIGHDSWRL